MIVGKVSRGVDVRNYGSGATGMTNVLRILGPRMAALVLVADLSKGIVAVLLAKLLTDTPLTEALAGILVIVGHNWPIFSRFQGGRGVTTALGALAVMSPIAAAASAAAFIPTVAISRYVSLGSVVAVLVAMVGLPILVVAYVQSWEYLIYAGVGGPIILWRHRENIRRLLEGTERRMGKGAEIQDESSTEGDR